MAFWPRLINQAKSFVARNLRIGKMSLLLASGHVSRLAIEKFVLIPLLLPVLGQHEIGWFIWLMGWVTMLSALSGAGFGDALMRLHAKSKESGQWPELLGSGAILTSLVSLVAALIGGIALVALSSGRELGLCDIIMLVALGGYLLLFSSRRVLDVGFRVELQFGKTAFIQLLAGLTVLSAIPLAYLLGTAGLGVGYAFSGLLAIAIQLYLLRGLFSGGKLYGAACFKHLALTAPAFAIVAGMGIASQVGSRLLLGIFRDFADVTVFFAAESVVAMATIPLAFISNVVYSLVARKRQRQDFSRGMILQHVLSSLMCSLLILIGIRLFGHWVLTIFFAKIAKNPELVAAAWPLLQILSIGAAAQVLLMLSRGFIYRFCSFRRILSYAGLNFVVLVGVLAIAVPRWGLYGAAWAVTIGNSFAGLLWFGSYLYIFLFRRSTRENS